MALSSDILCIGDLHIQKRNLRMFALFQDRVLSFIRSNGIRHVVILGDVLHTMGTLNVACLNAAVRFFKQLDDIDGMQTFVLVGNHDYIGPDEFLSKNHWMNSISSFHPRTITIIDKPVRQGNCVYVPYVPPGRFGEALRQIDTSGGDGMVEYVFCHQEFKGAVYEFGDDAAVSIAGDCIPMGFGLIVSGHIHKRQWLGNRAVYYTGTPYQTRFNEDADKTVALLRRGNVHEVAIDGIPRLITVVCTTIKELSDLKFNDTDLYRVIIRIDSGGAAHAKQFLQSAAYKRTRRLCTSVVFSYPSVRAQVGGKPHIPPDETHRDVSFKSILAAKIQANPDLDHMFESIRPYLHPF